MSLLFADGFDVVSDTVLYDMVQPPYPTSLKYSYGENPGGRSVHHPFNLRLWFPYIFPTPVSGSKIIYYRNFCGHYSVYLLPPPSLPGVPPIPIYPQSKDWVALSVWEGETCHALFYIKVDGRMVDTIKSLYKPQTLIEMPIVDRDYILNLDGWVHINFTVLIDDRDAVIDGITRVTVFVNTNITHGVSHTVVFTGVNRKSGDWNLWIGSTLPYRNAYTNEILSHAHLIDNLVLWQLTQTSQFPQGGNFWVFTYPINSFINPSSPYSVVPVDKTLKSVLADIKSGDNIIQPLPVFMSNDDTYILLEKTFPPQPRYIVLYLRSIWSGQSVRAASVWAFRASDFSRNSDLSWHKYLEVKVDTVELCKIDF